MQRRRLTWILLGLALLGGVIVLWRGGNREPSRKDETLAMRQNTESKGAAPQAPAVTQPVAATEKVAATDSDFPYRLTNTGQNADELLRNERGILLENALIDTSVPLNLAIPKALRAPEENNTYIVQARGPIDARFRELLKQAQAQAVSYIPNNAELVRVTASGARQLAASALVQAVLPYEPYYKLDPGLLKLAVETGKLPAEKGLNLTVFAGDRAATLAKLQQLGAEVAMEQRSPFGVTLLVYPAQGTFLNVVRLPGVMRVEESFDRVSANDLSRVRLGAATNGTTAPTYLDLSGSNVTINVNDSGVDQNHPDLSGRVTGDVPATLVDSNGHGTHVVGTIIGNGVASSTVNKASGSASNANFHGMATNASAYVIGIGLNTKPRPGVGGPFTSDADLQEMASRTNTRISANPWNYNAAARYDMFAASYDAAVRDADPSKEGPQPLVYVFSAGNGGAGNEAGKGGFGNTVWSPGTAKNVITVGAAEQARNITNRVIKGNTTNAVFQAGTDSSNQVASFSSRGNVGIGVEGVAGRFKPDLVAPGAYVVSDRSLNWDQAAYYDPTNHTVNITHNLTVDTNALLDLSTLVPGNAVQIKITVIPNTLSLLPFPDFPIYVKLDDTPTTTVYDFKGTNTVSLPPDAALVPGGTIFYSIGDGTNKSINFDVLTEVVTTNDQGNLLTVLSNLNEDLGPFYRYESGTSMAAAGVSGMLVLMQEFFEQRMGITNSPALMKALLINGARPLSGAYDFQVGSLINYEGWGLPNLSNSIPGGLTNNPGGTNSAPVRYFDQSLSNALATGQSKTWDLTLSSNAGTAPLRVTLVWTDPPGNPAAGVKLVNDLDLIVTNKDATNFYWGNDIPSGSTFNQPTTTNNPDRNDMVNNVENVYLQGPLGTNYSITVRARRVNVNAVTANTNDVVQDFALVISRGDGGLTTNSFTLTEAAVVASNTPSVQTVTDRTPLFGQRVGANSQYASTTNGVTNQWNFYVFTNTVATTNGNFTNVAFVTFSPPNLGVPRMGTRQTALPRNGTRTEADVDLYVSQDPNLTNLTPAAVNAAAQSLSRTGTERVLVTNSSAGQVYYIAIKSEDREGAEYGFVTAVTDQSFGQTDSHGNVVLTVISPALPAVIPPGLPAKPGSVTLLALTTLQAQVRKIVVTDTISHAEFGDLIGAFSHSETSVVLNNHSFFVNPGDSSETFVYDDSGENDPLFPGARRTDGPGSLQDFVGAEASSGVWMFTMVNDSSLNDTGTVDAFSAVVVPQPPTNGFSATVGANSWVYDFIDVPATATNLAITVRIATASPLSVQMYLRRDNFPDFTHYDKFMAINNPPGVGTMNLSIFDSPPLNPGRYFIGVFNPNSIPVQIDVGWTFGFSATANTPLKVVSSNSTPILDDAVTYSTNSVGISSRVDGVEVGVRIEHPRESDLVLTLVSPAGTRAVLAENRGGLDGNGYGAGQVTTNAVTASSGNALASTNIIPVGLNQGTVVIQYDMVDVPDDLRVYYDGVRLYDTGLVNGTGTIAVDFGPGVATDVVIIMNETGNPDTNTAWSYTAQVVTRQNFYANFTDDTNLTTLPIKFATPPFGTAPVVIPPTTNLISGFEVAPGDYGLGTNVDGWTVLDTNAVKVVSVPVLAADEGNAFAGNNVLAIHKGHLFRTIPTIVGRNYTLRFVHHGRPELGPVSWWKGEAGAAATIDSIDGNNGSLQHGAISGAGLVGQSLNLLTNNSYMWVADATNLHIRTNITLETWVYRTRSNIQEHVISKWDSVVGVNQRSYNLAVFNDNRAFFEMTPNGQFGFESQVYSTTPVMPGEWTHMAATLSNTTMNLYLNGRLEATGTASGAIFPGTNALTIGGDTGGNPPSGPVTFKFLGMIDEATVYSNAISYLQVQDIYAAGSAGKRLLPEPLVKGRVIFNGNTNNLTGNDSWTTNTYSFTATTNATTLELQSIDDGMLFDSFTLLEFPLQNPATYFLPEESLKKFIGENSQGDWKLEIWDNRAGATNPAPTLVSWQLSLLLDRLVPATIPLSHAIPNTNIVAANSLAYYLVDVPVWARFATNTLTTATGPLLLLFNQNQLPVVGDFALLVAAGGPSSATLDTSPTSPPLLPGQRYYLAVQNLTAGGVPFTIEVDFDITPLTNAVALTNTLESTVIPRYYQYDVTTNAVAVAFEVLHPTGDVALVARRGAPLPDEFGFDYISDNPGTNEERIIVVPNSTPVPLAAGRWYLGVFNHAGASNTYAIRATEFGPPVIIVLTNDVPYLMTNYPPGPSLGTFFQFDITQTNTAALFELYALNGDVDLTLQRDALPYATPFFASSTTAGTNGEQIVIRTNILGTNINASWFLGVPNNTTNNVNFTIRAVVSTNGLLISAVPPNPTVTIPPPASTNGPVLTFPAVVGETYRVEYTDSLLPPVVWTAIPPDVVATGATITITDPTPIVGVPTRFYRVVQIPTP